MADKEEDTKEFLQKKNFKKKVRIGQISLVSALTLGLGYAAYDQLIVPELFTDAIYQDDTDKAIGYLDQVDDGNLGRWQINDAVEYIIRDLGHQNKDVSVEQINEILKASDYGSNHALLLRHIYALHGPESEKFQHILEESAILSAKFKEGQYIGYYAINGHLDALQQIHQSIDLTAEDARHLFLKAAFYGQFETAEWLRQEFSLAPNDQEINDDIVYTYFSAYLIDNNNGQERRMSLARSNGTDLNRANNTEIRTYLLQHFEPTTDDILNPLQRNGHLLNKTQVEQIFNDFELNEQQQQRALEIGFTAPEIFQYVINDIGIDNIDNDLLFAQMVDRLKAHSPSSRSAPYAAFDETIRIIAEQLPPSENGLNTVIGALSPTDDARLITLLGEYFSIPADFAQRSLLTYIERNDTRAASSMFNDVTDQSILDEALIKASAHEETNIIWAMAQFGISASPEAANTAFENALSQRHWETAQQVLENFDVSEETLTQSIQALIIDGNIRTAKELQETYQEKLEAQYQRAVTLQQQRPAP